MKKKRTGEKRNKIDKNVALALTFGALNIADYLTTKRILKNGGVELNPFVNFLIKHKCFGVYKTFSTLAGAFSILIEEKPKKMTKLLILIYSFVVAHNIKEIVKYEGKNEIISRSPNGSRRKNRERN